MAHQMILADLIIYKSTNTVFVCGCICDCFPSFSLEQYPLSQNALFSQVVRDFIWTIGYCPNIGGAVTLLKS